MQPPVGAHADDRVVGTGHATSAQQAAPARCPDVGVGADDGAHPAAVVDAVVGTHTHVPTADERVLTGGTVLLTDVGMTGPYDSVIGMRADRVLKRFLLQTRVSFEVAKRDVRLAAAVIDIDEATGKARGIERFLVKDESQG